MKHPVKYPLLFFCLLISQNIFCQNWQPVQLSDKYNYHLDSVNYITHTIWIDSSEVINGDSVFYLNRIMTKCDTCLASLGGPNPCDTCYALSNQPQFLQRKMIQLANGVYNFRDTGNTVLKTFAQLSETWLFDSLQSISAQVVDISLQNILSIPDSVKTILLSTSDTLILSQSFGIIRYPNHYSQNSFFRLTGIEGLNIGEHMPNFWDIFNFDVGDMFEYHENGFCLSMPPTHHWRNSKYQIVFKQIQSSYIKYAVQGFFSQEYFPGGFSYGAFTDTLVYADSLYSAANGYCNQLLKYSDDVGCLPLLTNYLKVFNDSDGFLTKSFGLSAVPNQYDIYDILTSYPDIFNNYMDWWGIAEEYKNGLGQTFYSTYCFECMFMNQLAAFKKGSLIVGTFTPDSSFINGINNLESKNIIEIFPNPSSAELNIHFNSPSPGEIIIYNLLGEIMNTTSVHERLTKISVKDFPNGFYFASVRTQHGVVTKKIIVAH